MSLHPSCTYMVCRFVYIFLIFAFVFFHSLTGNRNKFDLQNALAWYQRKKKHVYTRVSCDRIRGEYAEYI